MFNSTSFAFFAILAFAGASSCTAPRYRYLETTTENYITESLFNSKERTITEADIQRILDGKIGIPDTIRLAVFQFGSIPVQHRQWYDEGSLNARQHLVDTFTQALKGAYRIQEVLLLPAIVTGVNPNIHQLRESAVRLQADMLLVYSLHSDIFQRYRVFKKEESKAYATCEAVLMDIRTGIIPFTHIATKSAHIKKEKEDINSAELQKRALNTAVMEAMLETGQQTASFLKKPK